MKVLMVTSEAVPFASSGGLGDVTGALPRAIQKEGNAVCEVILPLYRTMSEEYRQVMKKVVDFQFYLGWRKTGCSVFEIYHHDVRYLFVENHYYFDRANLYGEYDDGERFAFFCRAVIEYILVSGDIPDILHANDWQSALCVIYLKTEYQPVSVLSKIKTLYTIHNIEYQGKYDPYILGDIFAIDEKYLPRLEYQGALNLMKGAIELSDFVNTVSETYAGELRYPYYSFGLSPVIESIQEKFIGIVNGVDFEEISPEKKDIPYPYSIEDFNLQKKKNKCYLQKILGLHEDENVPLLCMITRLTEGKGISLIIRILDELLYENIQFVILGTGDYLFEKELKNIESRHKNLKVILRYDRALSKQIYASSDLFIMPSNTEPCGIAQMVACRYGTVPIVRKTGGLCDTIRTFPERDANGFAFDNYNAHECMYKIKDALQIYQDKRNWQNVVENCMKTDFSWNNSAKKYLCIYKNLIEQEGK